MAPSHPYGPAPHHAPLLRLAARPGSSWRNRKANAAADRVGSSSLAPRHPRLTSPVGSGPAGSASRPPTPQLRRPTYLLAQNLQVNAQVLYSKSKDGACYGVSAGLDGCLGGTKLLEKAATKGGAAGGGDVVVLLPALAVPSVVDAVQYRC